MPTDRLPGKSPSGQAGKELPTPFISLDSGPGRAETLLLKQLRVDPLWSYTSGLLSGRGHYAREGKALPYMFAESPGSLGLGFTSSEGASLEANVADFAQVVSCFLMHSMLGR